MGKLSVEEMMREGRRAQRRQELGIGGLLVTSGIGVRYFDWASWIGYVVAGFGAFMILHALTSRGTRA